MLNENPDDIDDNFINGLNDVLQKLNEHSYKKESEMVINESRIEVGVKKLFEDSVVPSYAKNGDAGLDLTINNIKEKTDNLITYGFGVAFEIPVGYVGLVYPRSSIRNKDLLLTNSVGVIDSGYRGEVMASFSLTNDKKRIYEIGERGAQLVIMPYPNIQMVEKNTLNETERGEGGYGSTGL